MKQLSMLGMTIGAILASTWLMLASSGGLAYLALQGVLFEQFAVAVAVVALCGAIGTQLFSRYYIFRVLGAYPVLQASTAMERWLLQTVASQAYELGLPRPQIAILNSTEMNAFTTGLGRQQAMIVLSQGLIKGLHHDELEAVLAHEISHIANGDMQTLAMSQGALNSFISLPALLAGLLVDRGLFRLPQSEGPAYIMTTIFLQFCFGWLASLLVMWFSRHREYRADRHGAALVGFNKMRAALQCLYAMKAARLPRQLAVFGISGRLGHGLRRLFMSHPTLGERLAALKQYD